jgi:hypothetical protein
MRHTKTTTQTLLPLLVHPDIDLNEIPGAEQNTIYVFKCSRNSLLFSKVHRRLHVLIIINLQVHFE